MPLEQYIRDTLSRLESEDSLIQAFIPEPAREHRLITEARELLCKYPNDKPGLFGVLIGVKDLFQVDRQSIRAGSKLPPEAFNGEEACLVSRLKEAGALILGITVSTEFAYFSPGPTRNPRNPEHSPGGSSSGSAAAVAMGICPLALGTQTIASINRPAAYCGVYGFKPSQGRIPTDGVFPFSQSIDQLGYFASKLKDICYVAPFIIEGWKTEQQKSKPKILVPVGAYLEQADFPSRLNLAKALEALNLQGIEYVEEDIFPDIEQINAAHRKLIAAEFAHNHRELYARYHDLYSCHSAELFHFGSGISTSELEELRKLPGLLRTRLEMALKKHQANQILTPGATGAAPLGLESTGSPLMSLPFTNAGLPTLSIPFGHDLKGLPFSLQFVSQFNADESLLTVSGTLEAILSSSFQ